MTGALLERHEACDVVVVAHSRPILAVLAEAAGLDFHEWTQHRVPTGSISRVEYSDEGAEIQLVGRLPSEAHSASLWR